LVHGCFLLVFDDGAEITGLETFSALDAIFSLKLVYAVCNNMDIPFTGLHTVKAGFAPYLVKKNR
jgi:hypothetical protein